MGHLTSEAAIHEQVYITGMGIINAIADSVPEFAYSLSKGVRKFNHLADKKVNSRSIIGAVLKDFSLEKSFNTLGGISKLPELFLSKAVKHTRKASLSMKTAVASTAEAWQQAELFLHPVKKDRIGIVVAGSNLTGILRESYYDKFQENPEYLTPQYALQFMDTDYIGTLSELFEIGGEGFSVGGASASGNVGIIKAYQLIQLGMVDVCVVVGALADLTNMELQGFYNIGALGGRRFINEPDKACRPFDKEHEGFIYGQASGCIILESGESVKTRKVRPFARLLGGSINLDGNRLSNPNITGEAGAMKRVLDMAGVKAEAITYINAHGSSSPLGDETELKAIQEVFTKHSRGIYINSTKGLTGHCLFSAGVVEAIACILQMNGGFIHPNANLENPIDNTLLFPGKTAILTSVDFALSNSFGFGGINTSILLQRT
ncbi:polyketide biosynthesis malonyl-ACP decarboxylase PksF [Anaerocolumna cellulosilytica]|uniref:Polyketide biosynthesis malonyl-ACP decarboxylase PksF n=1 Tax=Anaerocolumna cellulosilytica TaxID=433286 RepID=A0A6S6QRK9_9FIRM|nr:beta-ketoacyl synthase N-terminal-like domain-containing protein [Anaerocolumna cellulosilytica]MBB5196721.1 malonyl-ACP decarboxylase [Anaerocolumna cellulosilytica]BCJ93983.1 polyketide biosynthesis malonyl-ACP decarboxylase PksF [Anaerocolumna cellulosilytica]